MLWHRLVSHNFWGLNHLEYITDIDHSTDNIIVFTGILPICRDENGLAAVLGHGMYHLYYL